MPVTANTTIMKSAEAAEFLGLSIESLRKYVQRGRIKPVMKVGPGYLFTQEECERFKPTISPPGNPNFKKRHEKRRIRK